MKTKVLCVGLATLAVACSSFIAGMTAGYLVHPRAIVKNADLNMYSGGEVAHVTLKHCRVIADRTALDVKITDDCQIIDPPDGPAIAER